MTNLDILKMFQSDGTLAAVVASGNCMLPEIHNGDILLVDTRCELKQGNAVVFRYNGNQYCKYYFPNQDETVVMQPADLLHYESMKLNKADVIILGRVVSVLHEMPSTLPMASPGEKLPSSGNGGNATLIWQREVAEETAEVDEVAADVYRTYIETGMYL